MELTPRKREILAAIIKTYIESGEPVGSKVLCQVLDMGVSSATIRSEMNELEKMGYLEQPHTSAGRAPTNAGYRLYISQLMKQVEPDAKMRSAIDSVLEGVARDPERVIGLAGQALSDLTGLPALSATITNEKAAVRRIELIPMGRRAVLLVVIASDGTARSRLCRTETALSVDTLERFGNLAVARLEGLELSAFHPALLQTLVAESGEYGFALLPLFTALFEAVEDIYEAKLSLKGESGLFGFMEPHNQARKVLELITRRDALLSILEDVNGPVAVVFGDDTHITALHPSNMVVARFRVGQNELGRIGVIGPTRMAYEHVIPNIEYFAARLSTLLSKALEDMED